MARMISLRLPLFHERAREELGGQPAFSDDCRGDDADAAARGAARGVNMNEGDLFQTHRRR